MKADNQEKLIKWCILGAGGGLLMALGDWLLGCIPLQETDTGMFNRAYYLSGSYGLWRSVMTVGMGAIGAFLYYFMIKLLNADIDSKYKKIKSIHYLCGIFTVAVVLAIHTWSATLAWFTAYLGPRIGSDAAVAAVLAYQNDMLIAIVPMYVPMLVFIGIHFMMILAGKTRYPRLILIFHSVVLNLILVGIPDIAQTMQIPIATWMSVMSQSSTNSSIVIWCIVAAVTYSRERRQRV